MSSAYWLNHLSRTLSNPNPNRPIKNFTPLVNWQYTTVEHPMFHYRVDALHMQALIQDGYVEGIHSLQKESVAVLAPLGPHAALFHLPNTPSYGLSIFLQHSNLLPTVSRRNGATHLWLPEGERGIPSIEGMTWFPEHQVGVFKIPRLEVALMAVRVPINSNVLGTGYPEFYHQHSFRDHPKEWVALVRTHDGDTLSCSTNPSGTLHTTDRGKTPTPRDPVELLRNFEVRIARVNKTSSHNLFLHRAFAM